MLTFIRAMGQASTGLNADRERRPVYLSENERQIGYVPVAFKAKRKARTLGRILPAFLTFASRGQLRAAVPLENWEFRLWLSATGKQRNPKSVLGAGWEGEDGNVGPSSHSGMETTVTRESVCAFDLQATAPAKPQGVLEVDGQWLQGWGRSLWPGRKKTRHGASEFSL